MAVTHSITRLSQTDFVQRHLTQALAYVAKKHSDYLSEYVREADDIHDSPLETAFGAWWSLLCFTGEFSEDRFELQPQVQVATSDGKYRVDFAIVGSGPWQDMAHVTGADLPKIAIELDGHEFHERTREQVAYRNERDRVLQSNGWTILHYSGSELHHDAKRCVETAYRAAQRAYNATEDNWIRRGVVPPTGY